MIALQYFNVPVHLQKSELYRQMSSEGADDTFSIPEDCCAEETADNISDFSRLLKTTAFWGLDEVPVGLMRFCNQADVSVWGQEIEMAGRELQFAQDLKSIFSKPPPKRLATAIKLSRNDAVEFLVKSRSYDDEAVSLTAELGRADILQLLHEHGCPWNKEACSLAAKSGHLNCLQYLHENGCPWDYNVYISAERGRHFDCVRYAYEEGLPWHIEVSNLFAMRGNATFLKYAVGHRAPVAASVVVYAIRGGNIECLRCVLDTGIDIPRYACKVACDTKQLDCLHLLREYGASLDVHCAESTAMEDRLPLLQQLRQDGCPWNASTTQEATRIGSVNVLRYAMENGCSHNDSIVAEATGTFPSSMQCLRYLIEEQGLYMDNDGSVFAEAFTNGSYEAVAYLLDNGCPFQDSGGAFRKLIGNLQFRLEGDDIRYDDQRYDRKVLKCLTCALEHGWDINTSGRVVINFVQSNAAQMPECFAYLQDEGYL